MAVISKSVGHGGVNVPADVRAVQQLLNRNLHLLKHVKPLVEDDFAGSKTVTAIREFQRLVLHLPLADGLVSPGGATLTRLVATARPARPANVAAFLANTLAAAREVKATYGIPMAILIAQGALESGWGARVKDNAYFGIKGKSQKGSSTSFTTTEFVNGKKVIATDTFRAYADFAEAADDYGAFLSTNPRYAPCFATTDPFAFAEQLQASGYATDPQYATKLKSIIRTYYLDDYDR